MTRPRLGFLGVGWIGRHRLRAIAAAGVAEITAVCDPSGEATAAALADAPGALVAADLEALLALPLDGVVIATPSALHAAQAVAALERGVAVFCQKPLARTAADAAWVVAAARTADRLLHVDFSYRHSRAMEAIRDLIAAGALGRVFAADLTFHNAYGPDKAWFYDPALAGGGCVMDLGVHLVDLALWCLGMPHVMEIDRTLFAEGTAVRDPQRRVEDFALARLVLDTGAVVRLACSWRLHAGQDCVIEAAFYGTRGGATMRNVNGSFYDLRAERSLGTTRELLASPPDEWGGRAAVAWARALAAGAGFDPSAEDAVRVAEVLDRIYQREADGTAAVPEALIEEARA